MTIKELLEVSDDIKYYIHMHGDRYFELAPYYHLSNKLKNREITKIYFEGEKIILEYEED